LILSLPLVFNWQVIAMFMGFAPNILFSWAFLIIYRGISEDFSILYTTWASAHLPVREGWNESTVYKIDVIFYIHLLPISGGYEQSFRRAKKFHIIEATIILLVSALNTYALFKPIPDMTDPPLYLMFVMCGIMFLTMAAAFFPLILAVTAVK